MPSKTVDRIAVGAVAALIVAAVLACWLLVYQGGERFDSARWKSDVECRDDMLHDLRSNRLRYDLTSDDLIDLLGPPDRDLQHTEVSSHKQHDFRLLYYRLSSKNQSFDSHYFVVVLDVNMRYLRSFVVNS